MSYHFCYTLLGYCRARSERVKELMIRDDDFRSYYFVPAVDPRAHDRVADYDKKYKEEFGQR